MKRAWTGLLAVLGILAFSLAACDSDGEEETANLPDATGASVWQHLQQENYTQSWRLWPGTEALYQGSDPHGMLLTTYVNDLAFEAIMDRSGTMPDGAMIVKENYMPDNTFDAVTTMYKVDGYDAEHNDWFWVKQSPTGVVEVEGRVEGCRSCHQAAADNDYLFTGSIQ